MTSGNIGSASLKRLDYTVIRDAVNMAQQLQAVASPKQILISQTTFQQISPIFHCQEVGQITIKNKKRPVLGYEISGTK